LDAAPPTSYLARTLRAPPTRPLPFHIQSGMTTTVAGVRTEEAIGEGGVTRGLLLRIRGEFLEMPGLRLTLRQAMRLWNLDAATCEAALRHLVDHRFLSYTAQGAFRRWEA
jgi:hypothetical protein